MFKEAYWHKVRHANTLIFRVHYNAIERRKNWLLLKISTTRCSPSQPLPWKTPCYPAQRRWTAPPHPGWRPSRPWWGRRPGCSGRAPAWLSRGCRRWAGSSPRCRRYCSHCCCFGYCCGDGVEDGDYGCGLMGGKEIALEDSFLILWLIYSILFHLHNHFLSVNFFWRCSFLFWLLPQMAKRSAVVN